MGRPRKDPSAPRVFQVSFDNEAEVIAGLREKYREHYSLVNEDVDKVKPAKLVALAVRDIVSPQT